MMSRATADEDWNKDTAQAEFRLFDGTVITIRGRAVDDKHWIPRDQRLRSSVFNERFVQSKRPMPLAPDSGSALERHCAFKSTTPRC